MTDSAARFAVHWATYAAAFVAAWIVAGFAIGFGYVKLMGRVNRRRDRQMREFLTMEGRYARAWEDGCWRHFRDRDARMAETFHDVREATREARAMARIAADLRRAPLAAVPELEETA